MTVIGKYEILSQLGAGSSGIVYRAIDHVLGRYVALKVMRPETQLNPEIAERFRREARACAQLQHPNIVTVYDLAETDGGATYIAMELLSGTDLKTAIRQRVHLPAAVKIRIIAEVCEALGHAHQHGIVHRDVKPSNLFLSGGAQPKILDFGVAKLATSVLTRTGKILGTPNYMAPEQITGRKCEARSDLFSAAIVLFELLTGSHPFHAPFIPKRIVNDEPDYLCELDPRLPLQLQADLTKAMAKEPDQRFQSGEEFAAALRDVLGSGNLDFEDDITTPASAFDDAGAETATVASPLQDERTAAEETGIVTDSGIPAVDRKGL
jgi:serine/threonine protein kinase